MTTRKLGKTTTQPENTTLGEREIIEIIKSHLEKMPNLPVPFGDDVSAVDLNHGQTAILKTDMLVGKTDVPPNMSLWQAARKAIVMNISDFASKGVQPKAALVALGLPQAMTKKDIEEIAKGLNAGARQYDAYIIGGDTGEATDLIISIALFGTAQKTKLMLRKGTKPDDIIAVTGLFGKPAAGLRLLLNKCQAQPDIRKPLLEAVYMPKAKLKEGLALSETNAVSASTDSSDGLAWSLHEIATNSNVGFTINNLPIDPEAQTFAEQNNLNPTELTLYGGEEYELVTTIKPNKWQEAKTAIETTGGKLLPIGKATKEKQLTLEINDKKSPIKPKGWEHFKTKI